MSRDRRDWLIESRPCFCSRYPEGQSSSTSSRHLPGRRHLTGPEFGFYEHWLVPEIVGKVPGHDTIVVAPRDRLL